VDPCLLDHGRPRYQRAAGCGGAIPTREEGPAGDSDRTTTVPRPRADPNEQLHGDQIAVPDLAVQARRSRFLGRGFRGRQLQRFRQT
ncbi:hypothetical protein, partial [Porticoccus sp.]